MRPFTVLAVAIVALGALAIAAVSHATQGGSPALGAARASLDANAQPLEVGAPGGAGLAPAPPPAAEPAQDLTAPRPAPPGVAPGAAAVILVGPDPREELPPDADARSQALLEARRARFADGMDFLNRRNAQRLGRPPPPPSAAAVPGGPVATSRRGALSGAGPTPRAAPGRPVSARTPAP